MVLHCYRGYALREKKHTSFYTEQKLCKSAVSPPTPTPPPPRSRLEERKGCLKVWARNDDVVRATVKTRQHAGRRSAEARPRFASFKNTTNPKTGWGSLAFNGLHTSQRDADDRRRPRCGTVRHLFLDRTYPNSQIFFFPVHVQREPTLGVKNSRFLNVLPILFVGQ